MLIVYCNVCKRCVEAPDIWEVNMPTCIECPSGLHVYDIGETAEDNCVVIERIDKGEVRNE